MDVAKLFDQLRVSQHIEIEVANLPELLMAASQQLRGFALENADRGGKRVSLGLADKKMNVIGHEDVAEDIELMSLPEAFEGFFEEDAGS